MTGVEFHGFTRILNPPDKWRDQDAHCIPLYVRDYKVGETPIMESVWSLSPTERDAIAHGAYIALAVVGTVHPPVALRISEYRVLDEAPFKEMQPPEVQVMTELEEAVIIANKVLDRTFADPDDDLAILARQFLRSRESVKYYVALFIGEQCFEGRYEVINGQLFYSEKVTLWEVDADGYERQELTDEDIRFPRAKENWGLVIGAGKMTEKIGGQIVSYVSLIAPQFISGMGDGDQAMFDRGHLVFP